ncbi:TPA: glycoside hydrolase N-terminal domain-containing protein, partial [Streptococcus suis]
MGSRIFERKERFSIRKLSIGTCSVVLGSLMIMPQVAAAQSAEDDLGGFVSLDSSRQETGTDLSYQVNASPEGTPSGSNVIEPMANSITEPIIEGEADLATEPMTTADLPSHSQEARNASAVTLAETETLATDSLEEDQILEERDYHLVYDRPAAESYIGWERESLPIGNGEMGSKVFGLVGKERIQFNEKTLWSGGPTPNDQTYNGGNIADRYTYLDDIRQALEEGNQALATSLAERQLTGPYSPQYGRYLSFGDVLIDFVNQPKDLAEVTDYNRQLDLNQAVTTTSYKVDETLFTRDHFVSYPDDVAVTHLAKEGQMSLDFDLKLKMTTDMLNGQFNSYTNQVSPYKTGQVAYDQSGILLSGYVNDNLLKFAAYLGLDTDGQVDVLEDRLSIRNASYANLVMSAKTDYAQDPLTNYRADVNPVDLAKATVEKALEKSYDQILQDHVSDHQSLFNRVQLHLQDQGHYDTTNQMLAQYDPTTDRKLEETFFQFGRYLMIASSRDGENHLPANLQGVWNGVDNPPWNSDYHLNVNLQMNYWPVYSANLAESAKPLINFVDDLRYYGRQAAAAYAGIESQEGEENGWLVHTQVTPFGWTTPGWDYYWGWSPASNAWIMQNVYDYYRFTQDKTYLQEKIYPMLKETAKFWNQFLHYDAASDRYVSSPSYSPEHGTISIGNTYDQSLVWQLFHDYIEAAQILDLDQDFVAEVQEKFEKLQPLHINAAGRIKEWYEEDTPAFTGARVEANHRHVSELVGLFPGTLFSKDQPDYLDAARATLNARGDGGTGWSKANKINLWARLLDGNRAHRLLSEQLKHSTLANLWDTHPPFQIDGNFGATSGMVEMLLQSHNGYIAPLAALPDVWADGSVTGLMARGNVQVDMDWKQNTLSNLVLTAKSGGQVVIDYPHIELANIKINGQATDFERVKDHRIAIDTQVGDIITIDHILPRVHLTGLERTGYHSAQLSFTPIEGADRYLIQRTKVTDPSEIVTFTTDQTTFTDDYLVMDQDYRYEVTAVLDGYHLLASDAREIAGIKTILDDRDPSILYGSSFGDWNDPDQYLGTEKYVDITNQAGVDQASTQLSFTFYGSGLEIYGNKASALGHSSVTIDGQKVGQIDQYNTSTTKQALLGRFENLGDGLHEVTIQLNHQSKGRPGERVKMSLDYFKVLGLEQIDPNPPQPLPDPGAEPETPDQPSEPSNPESEAPVTAKGPGLVNEGETFVFDLTADDDNDGYSNQEELMAGSDYQNERSTPAPVTAKGPGLVNEGETFVFDLAADDDNDGYS